MLKKRSHNHNNNQTKPKPQPNTKNKPTTNPLKIHTHKKTHNNNQTKNKGQQPQKQAAPFFANSTVFSSIGQNSLNNYFSLNQACRCCLNNMLHKLYLTSQKTPKQTFMIWLKNEKK
jgi:hypothetical protein